MITYKHAVEQTCFVFCVDMRTLSHLYVKWGADFYTHVTTSSFSASPFRDDHSDSSASKQFRVSIHRLLTPAGKVFSQGIVGVTVTRRWERETQWRVEL